MNRIKNKPLRNLTIILKLLPIVCILMTSGNAYPPAQGSETTWQLLESDYPDGLFMDVSFLNVTHGWIVGRQSDDAFNEVIVLYTDDGGDSWQLQHNSSSQKVTIIDVIDEQTAWINGFGSLFYTLDGGKTWNESVVVGGMRGMSTVKFINKTHGWTANNEVLYRTTNSGQSWESVPGWNFSDNPQMMQVLSPLDIWACGFGGIYHSTDGGEAWARSSDLGGWALSFVSDTEGWVIDDNRLAYTNDGDTWQEQIIPMRVPVFRLSPPYTTDIQFIDEDNGWIVGDEIKVMYTPDGGANWYEQGVPSDATGRMIAVDFINQTHGWVVGNGGTILRTYTGNTLGTRLWKGMTDPQFLSIVFLVGIVFIVSVGGIVKIRRRSRKLTSVEIK